jgi:hypothetical protein
MSDWIAQDWNMRIRNCKRTGALILAAILGILTCIFTAASGQESRQRPPNSNGSQEEDRKDFDWTVRLSKPELTCQLRYLATASATIPAESLGGRTSAGQLRGTVAISDADGRRLKEANPTILNLPANLAGGQEIRFIAGFYLRSGTYRVAVAVEDPAAGRKNVWHGRLRVPALPGSPFPNWDEHFPQVEFTAHVPDGVLAGGPRYGIEIWPLAHSLSRIAIPTIEPVRIDVVLVGVKTTRPRNTDGLVSSRGGRVPSGYSTMTLAPFTLSSSMGMPLQIGSLLSLLEVRGGCIRISLLDYRQNRIFVDRQDARTVNWDDVQQAVWTSGQKTVDLGTLENYKGPMAFLKEQLVAILSDTGGCGPAGQGWRRIVVLVGYDYFMRPGTQPEVLDPKIAPGCRFYYFRPGSSQQLGITELLKPMRPRVLDFLDERGLSKALTRFVNELGR